MLCITESYWLGQLVKYSGEQKRLQRGVREVVKALRKERKGLVLLAGGFNCVNVGCLQL